jgi:hypothetical protein
LPIEEVVPWLTPYEARKIVVREDGYLAVDHVLELAGQYDTRSEDDPPLAPDDIANASPTAVGADLILSPFPCLPGIKK